MPRTTDANADAPVLGVLFDLLMAIMDSLALWSAAAGDRWRGLAWRDAVTAQMIAHPAYVPYEDLVGDAARQIGLPSRATADLFERWPEMSPRPDAAAIARLVVPHGFVTNCSSELTATAARRSGLRPAFALSAEEAGWYKPAATIYREACRRLGSPPKRTLLVAGSVYDAEGAHHTGLRASLVLRRPDQRPPREPVLVVASLEEIVMELERKPSPSRG